MPKQGELLWCCMRVSTHHCIGDGCVKYSEEQKLLDSERELCYMLVLGIML